MGVVNCNNIVNIVENVGSFCFNLSTWFGAKRKNKKSHQPITLTSVNV